MTSIYERDLDRNPANHQPLTPLTQLERAARVFPERTAIIHGTRRTSYADFSPAPGDSPRRWPPAASARATPSR
ncbi:acyl-CoA synthetase [Methylobrevis pamukkalensis]|uniref:Acyl-CoA synthetase n=1 Tax=Methylobrevis pamukkalensis TaxID=1439726 RepID=A0A1E3H147_9HYPH|nr:acyl-CoA synthetase [Methylobrevis pamukkalensis]